MGHGGFFLIRLGCGKKLPSPREQQLPAPQEDSCQEPKFKEGM
jgi:hypothetical protein